MDLIDLQDRLAFIEKTCSELGRDYDAITKSWGCWFWIYENERELNRYANEVKRLANLPEGSPNTIKGTPEEVVEMFESLIELGITYFTLRFEDLPSKRGLRLFAEHVIPQFK